jgi:hypothetical protein
MTFICQVEPGAHNRPYGSEVTYEEHTNWIPSGTWSMLLAEPASPDKLEA